MAKDDPMSEESATGHFEAVVAAILATATVSPADRTPDSIIKAYKQMLKKLRDAGGLS
jgi:hypothetical protein